MANMSAIMPAPESGAKSPDASSHPGILTSPESCIAFIRNAVYGVAFGALESAEATELPDLKNGAPEPTKRTEARPRSGSRGARASRAVIERRIRRNTNGPHARMVACIPPRSFVRSPCRPQRGRPPADPMRRASVLAYGPTLRFSSGSSVGFVAPFLRSGSSSLSVRLPPATSLRCSSEARRPPRFSTRPRTCPRRRCSTSPRRQARRERS